MSPETRDVITWILGTAVTASVLIGLGTKFVLMPYLKEHLISPMKQVEKQVTENHHSNSVPTVLDRIDDVQEAVEDLRREMRGMASMYEGHVNWSDRWVSLIERELDHLRGGPRKM